MIWDGHIPIWTVTAGWNQLKASRYVTADVIPPDSYDYDTTFRHSEDIEGGRDPRRGPNAVLADGHVERRISFRNRSDDDFNIPVN